MDAGLRLMLCGNMDAQLIGIELTQLLLKLKAPAETAATASQGGES